MADENEKCQARLPFKEVPDDLKEKVRNLGGDPNLNLYKTLANNPVLLSSWIDFAYSIRQNCTTSRTIRELMILRGAQLCQSRYEWFQHEKMAKQCGLSQEKIDAIDQWRNSALFDEKEKIALELMESLIENKGKMTQQLDERLKKSYSEAEYIELVLTGSFYVMVPTVLEALQIPIEKLDQ